MKSHIRIYTFPELVTFSFDPMFCDLEDETILPFSRKIETLELHINIQEEGNGKFYFSVSLPESVICSGDMGDQIVFWNEGDLTIEQFESDIEQMIEKKELYI